MTEHDHMPPISRYTARWLCPGKVVLVVDGKEIPASRDDALKLALAITDTLLLERK